MPALQILAGTRARKRLLENGFNANDFGLMLGASGGPKWMVLFGLDQYLFGDFFKHRTQPLQVLGTSAGAWRFACFAQTDAVAASQRFADAYRDACFAKGSSSQEITAICRNILDYAVPASALDDILNNPLIRLNVIANRSHGWVASSQRWQALLGLGTAALYNAWDRRTLGQRFERILFHADSTAPSNMNLTDLPTQSVALSRSNLQDVVLASGSIPLVLDGVDNIHGAPPGHYVDGGVTDYHFDLACFDQQLTLYPHFYPQATPGWFDKALKKRHQRASQTQNLVMLAPHPEWVANLPFGKIPDRQDFVKMDDASRIRYWNEVMQRSQQLAEELDAIVQGADISRWLSA